MDRVDGYNLLHKGVIALAEIEANGMRIDVPYLDKVITKTANRIQHLEGKLRGCDEYKLQRRRYGQKVKIASRDQLGSVLFKDLGHEPMEKTKTGRAQLDETMLERIGSKYAKGFLRLEKLKKLHGTYLLGVRRATEGEYVHGFFNLHLVRSYRGQSNDPNMQNMPIRDDIQGKVIRRAFIPREGHALIEVDYSSIEVMVACALSGDPKLTFDATMGDMHRDMAAECYFLAQTAVTKAVRQATKGSFVFAEFYGDWYKQITKNLWDGMDRYGLTHADGTPLQDHLKAQGVKGRGECDPDKSPRAGTFEHHIKAVEDRFWGERFKVYNDIRKKWVEEYTQQGYIDIATGFRCMGPMTRNQVMNYKIQGPAFQCLLWSLIEIIKEVKRRKMKTKIVGQIHDSIIADVPLNEVDEYLILTKEITTRKLMAHWAWLTVPFEIEAEIAYTNWHEKRTIKIPT